MFWSLILGFAAGAASPYAEPHIKKSLEGVLLSDVPWTTAELKLFSFAVCLVAASLLAWILGSPLGFFLAVGGAAGVFYPRILQAVQTARKKTPDYDDE